MKKVLGISSICILVIAAVFLLINSNDLRNENSLEEGKYTLPSTERQINAELQTYSFDNAVKEAELIAELTIGKQIKEIDEPSPKTLFEATVTEVFKGSNDLKTIEVLQEGNSEWIFNNTKQFSPNEKYILFLKKAVGGQFNGSDVYWIIGAETNTYSVVDSNIVVKNALYDVDLKSIEEDALPVSTQNLITNEDTKIQVLNKEKFEMKIIELVSKY